ncbi:MAG: fumarate hydratase [Candidatus Symbiobacter sp.]|nr:fumarate hydratase [Candidatus Symbiobacter sp.]
MFHLAQDTTPYRRLDGDFTAIDQFRGQKILCVAAAGLTKLAATAFYEMAFFLRPGHLAQLAKILDDPEASDNDRFVALDLLKNAAIAAGGVLPMCQDTGTAIVIGHKGQNVWSEGDDEAALTTGIKQTYAEQNLRYSQLSPVSMFAEVNTATNLPAQIDIFAEPGDEYHFLMLAKGGGSANKTYFYQQTPSVLSAAKLLPFLDAQMRSLGTSACPPYHLAVVIGGLSAEMTLKTVKLASTRYLDGLPTTGGGDGAAFRDIDMEAQLLDLAQKNGIGAQFGGKYFCHDVRVIRLPRHGASMPIGLGVSCSADRQVKAKITRDGLFVEELEHDPARFLPAVTEEQLGGNVVAIDINQPMAEIRRKLSAYPVKTRLSLSGKLIVARDLAHAKIRDRLESGQGMPSYCRDHLIYYAGPAKTPAGYASGSFGPTTAGRMDGFMDQFMAAGGSFVTLAKGNRSPAVTAACKKHGGFYLGSIGGPAARLAQDAIKSVKVLEYPELGMEAVWEIEVVNFPAFIVVDDKGNDFFAGLV